jgi:amino acid adenylation domain-containing protein
MKMKMRNKNDEHVICWHELLAKAPRVINVPTDNPRSKDKHHSSNIYQFELTAKQRNDIESFSKAQKVTTFDTLLSVLALLLHVYSRDKVVNIGVPLLSQIPMGGDQNGVISCNTLVLPCSIDLAMTVSEFVIAVFESRSGGCKYPDLSFDRIIETLDVEEDLTYHPLFQVKFNTHSVQLVDGQDAYPPVDLTFQVRENRDTFLFEVESNATLFGANTIERMAATFVHLVTELLKHPDKTLQELDVLNQTEKNKMLLHWNDTARDYPKNKTISQLFETQVDKTPEGVALIYDRKELTYQGLNEKSNQLAHYLRRQGVKTETLIGICCERSIEMIVGILGIIKAGGAYVPMDPTYPRDRLRYILHDSNIPILLTQSHLQGLFSDLKVLQINMDKLATVVSNEKTHNLNLIVESTNLFYVIYTSGSTGNPKGVMIQHQSVINIVDYFQGKFHLTCQSKWLSVTSCSFDIFGLELYQPLLHGAAMILCKSDDSLEPAKLMALIATYQVDFMQATPSTWKLLKLQGWKGQRNLTGICGGEAMPISLQNYFNEIEGLYCNMYGPTETTIWSSIWIVNDQSVRIGKPIANTEFYILSPALKPVPIGVVGELYIGGDGLARGYLNRPELTAERFIDNPFVNIEGGAKNSSARLYRTGDLCRYLEDGSIEYIGRTDFQVKIRGFRIELGEIESQLFSCPDVSDAVVLVREDEPGNLRLVAYIITHAFDSPKDKGLIIREMRNLLKSKLPDHMIPSAFVILERFPSTPNGKIDRKALPKPESLEREMTSDMVLPSDEVQIAIAAAWRSVLGIGQVSIDEKFFDAGGSSLLVPIVFNSLNSLYPGVLNIVDLYVYPTIAVLAEHIKGKAGLKKKVVNQNISEKKVNSDVTENEIKKMNIVDQIKLLNEDD